MENCIGICNDTGMEKNMEHMEIIYPYIAVIPCM